MALIVTYDDFPSTGLCAERVWKCAISSTHELPNAYHEQLDFYCSTENIFRMYSDVPVLSFEQFFLLVHGKCPSQPWNI